MSSPPLRLLVLDRTNELAARLRHNVVAPGTVVKACPDAGRAEALLAAHHWDVVIAGPSLMHRGGLRRLASLHQRYPAVAIVLALHERPQAELAEIIQVGASDLLPLHTDDEELRRALQRVARLTRVRLGTMADGTGGATRGRTLMVASASGGAGKTFLATNAAEFLARTTDQPVVLVDLDLQFGAVSTALRLRRETTITDALAAEAEGHDLEEILDDFLLNHPDGFKVLAAPRLPAEADSVTPGDVARILDVLRARRVWVVIDTHEGLSDIFTAALDATDHVFAVATPDRPSLVNLDRFLRSLERLGLAPGNVSVVLNKTEDAGPMAIPYSRDVLRSVNVGVPLIVGKPKSTIARLLTTLLSEALPKARKAGKIEPPVVIEAVPDTVEPLEAEIEVRIEIDLRPAEPVVKVVLTDDGQVEIDLAESLPLAALAAVVRGAPPVPRACRNRAPPRPLSPLSHPSLVPSLVTK